MKAIADDEPRRRHPASPELRAGGAMRSSPGPTAMQRWLAIFLLIAAPLAAMGPVCIHNFLNYDDVDQLAGNPAYQPVTRRSLKSWWTTPRMNLYMPVTNSVWGLVALDAYEPGHGIEPGQLDPVPFHAANLVAHVFCGLVVFALLEMLIGGVWPAAMGALLFELHPMMVEPVAWISELNTVLSALLGLWAVWAYLRAARLAEMSQSQSRSDAANSRLGWRGHYAAAIVLFVAAMLAKPEAVVAPLLAAVLDVMMLRRSWRTTLKWLWPWGVLASACALETVIFQTGGTARWNVAWYWRPAVALDSLAFYVQKLLWPRAMAVDYGLRPNVLLHDPWLIAKCLILAGIGVLLWRMRRSARPIVAGAVLFLIPLLPVLGLITFDFQWYSNVADHYLYLPMFGAALIAAWICRRWNRWPVYAAGGVVLAVLGVASNLQASLWSDTGTLFTHNLAVNKTSAVALDQFTRLALDAHDSTAALVYAQRNIAAHPDEAFAWRAAGIALSHTTPPHFEHAVAAFSRARQISPQDPLTLEDLAGALMGLKQYAQAEQAERDAVALAPESAEVHYNLALILDQQGKLSEARAEAQRAAQLAPSSPSVRMLVEHLTQSEGK